jgi:hypothetical protein
MLFAVTSCATTRDARIASDVDLVIDVARKNVRIGEQMFPIADDVALRAAISGACSNGCDVVEVRPTPGAPFVALHAVQVAISQSNVKKGQLRFAGDTVVPIGHDPQTTEIESCPAQIIALADRMYIYAEGEVLKPTEGCHDWGASVCGSAEAEPARRYDWQELRRRLRQNASRFDERVCVNLDSDAPAEVLERIVSIADEAHPTDGFVLRTGKRGGQLEAAAVETVIRARQVRLQGCYEEALSEASGPMSFTLRLVIGPRGRVDRAGIIDARGTTEGLEACILGVAEALEFPKPSEGGNVVVDYPLSFSPSR